MNPVLNFAPGTGIGIGMIPPPEKEPGKTASFSTVTSAEPAAITMLETSRKYRISTHQH